jgi:hypothetical protein
MQKEANHEPGRNVAGKQSTPRGIHLGPPYQRKKNNPELKIAVITFASYVGELPMKDRSRILDFIWLEE